MILLPLTSSRRNALPVWTATATTIAAALLLAFFVTVDAGAILGEQRREKDNSASRPLHVENLSGRKVDMFWVNVFKKPEEFVPQFIEDGVQVGCAYGADKSISSYIGHTFEIRELPSKYTHECVYNECRKIRYTVTDQWDQKIVINEDFTLTVKDEKERAFSKAATMFEKCQEKAKKEFPNDPLQSIEAITNCMQDEVSGKVTDDKSERKFHSKVHRTMAAELVPFTCADVNKTESVEIKNQTWVHNDERHLIKTLHKLPTSEIFVADNFVDKETCQALSIYKQKTADGQRHGVPTKAAMEKTKQGELLMELYYKLYDMLMDRFQHWKELDFEGDMLFEHLRDMEGFDTPTQLCTTQEDVDAVVAEMKAGKSKTCLIPGGVPEAAPTKHIIAEADYTPEEKTSKRQLAQLFVFCDEPEHLGGIHFPYAAVHATPKKGKLVAAIHRHEGDVTHGFDGYVNEYHLCPNHNVYVHTVTDLDPKQPPQGDDEGEL